ncbi:unnamed protein product, partial [Prunus brigantina]
MMFPKFWNQSDIDWSMKSDNSVSEKVPGGALKKKNAQESYNIYEMLGSNAQHKDTRGKRVGMYEISSNNDLALQVASLEKKLDSMLNMVPKIAEVCAICNIPGHPTYQCSASEAYPEFIQEQVNLMNSYNQRPRNDPFSNTYNPGPTQEENEKSNDDPSNATFSYEAPSLHKAEKPYTPPIPFPGRLAKSKQDKNMPAYGKFFKELNTYKRKYGPNEKVMVSENVSAVLQRKLPPKLKDPGSFSIDITIGGKLVEKAMLDLGASINLMPYSVYLQLVLDMEEAPIHDRELPILLGRPFMATAKTIIDVQNGLLTMTVLGETVQFKVFESLSHPSSSFDCCSIDVLDSIVFSKFLLAQSNDPLQYVLSQSQNDFDEEVLIEIVAALEALKPYPSTFSPLIEPLGPSTHLIPSVVKPPELELKPLPSHLKYAYLAEFETLPVIIASDLTSLEEDKLIRVLKEFKSTIGWSIADIKGISPTMCMHRILLEEGAKPTREPQRRLNPNMKEVVRAEVLKLLDVGVIYPISDSKWVSAIHVVPKRRGVTVVKNEHKELVETRPATSWRVCTDYRKLNSDTRKDYFPMPFIDQMLERLAGHTYYCFLDGYSGYNQIVIAPEDQEKTTFTCSFGTFAYRRMPFGLCNAPATF